MKITVDGKVVYLGPCETAAYVYVGEQSQGDSPIPVKATVELELGILVDLSEDNEVVGVEILTPTKDFLSAVSEARENGLTDEVVERRGTGKIVEVRERPPMVLPDEELGGDPSGDDFGGYS